MRCMTSNGICRGFAFKYGKFPLPLRYRTALSVPKVPTMYSNVINYCFQSIETEKQQMLLKQLPFSLWNINFFL